MTLLLNALGMNWLSVTLRCRYLMPVPVDQSSTAEKSKNKPLIFYYPFTVQTFNSCTSRRDVCQCLVAQTPMDNMSKNEPITSMTHVDCLRIKGRFSCEVIHLFIPRKRGCNRACGRVLCTGYPRI